MYNIVVTRIAVALGLRHNIARMPKKAKQAKKNWSRPQAHALLRYQTPECWAMLACSGVFFSLPLCSAAAAAFSFCTARLELSITHASQTPAPRRGAHTHNSQKNTFLLYLQTNIDTRRSKKERKKRNQHRETEREREREREREMHMHMYLCARKVVALGGIIVVRRTL